MSHLQLISRAALDRFTRALVANVTSQSTSGELEGPSNSNRIDPDILAAALREEHTYRYRLCLPVLSETHSLG